jgi:hypothetical protein
VGAPPSLGNRAAAELASCVYEGQVRHRRFTPRPHEFRYTLFLWYLDLDELPRLFTERLGTRWLWSATGPAVAWFRRADHLGPPSVPLKTAVADLVERRTGRRPGGPIRLLTHLRYFGYGFNPVSFYYCFDAAGETVETIVAEVNNTPWGEQHCYVLDGRTNRATTPGHFRFVLDKVFHVSPFMGMDVTYDWRFTAPGSQVTVHMDNLPRTVSPQGSAATTPTLFDATLTLSRTPLVDGGGPQGIDQTMARMLARFPFMTGKVIGAIYGEALRLWLKCSPFHPHPRHSTGNGTTATPSSTGSFDG